MGNPWDGNLCCCLMLHHSILGCCTSAQGFLLLCSSWWISPLSYLVISPLELPSAILVWAVLPFATHATAHSGSGCSQLVFARLRIPWTGAKARPADVLQGSMESWRFCSKSSCTETWLPGKILLRLGKRRRNHIHVTKSVFQNRSFTHSLNTP